MRERRPCRSDVLSSLLGGTLDALVLTDAKATRAAVVDAFRLSPGRLAGAAADVAFLSEPNDLVVAVRSARGLPTGRTPEPLITQVACDHLSFFTTSAGLSALAESLPARRLPAAEPR